MRRFCKNKKGFTLIEVIVVIAIVAILGMIVTASTIAVLRNAESKAAEKTLRNYWNLTSKAVDQANLGLTIGGVTKDLVKTRLGITNANTLTVSTSACKDLKEGYTYVQYSINNKSINHKYTLTRITINYKGNIYYIYMSNGTLQFKGPNSSV